MEKKVAPTKRQGIRASSIIPRDFYERIKGTPDETDAALLSLPIGLFFVLLIDLAVKSWI